MSREDQTPRCITQAQQRLGCCAVGTAVHAFSHYAWGGTLFAIPCRRSQQGEDGHGARDCMSVRCRCQAAAAGGVSQTGTGSCCKGLRPFPSQCWTVTRAAGFLLLCFCVPIVPSNGKEGPPIGVASQHRPPLQEFAGFICMLSCSAAAQLRVPCHPLRVAAVVALGLLLLLELQPWQQQHID